MKIIKKILCLCLFILLLAIATALGYYYATTKNSTLCPEKLLLHEKHITIYDENSQPIQNVSSMAKGETASIDEIPSITKIAFVNTEDKRFYVHHGFDTLRIAKALWRNFTSLSFKEGASTISQQLIKNTHLSQEKTLNRKLKEWKLTNLLEKRYSKDEILEKYLNTIYFGHNCFGIRSAAEFYFGKTPSELNLSDSAILAGLVKSPNNYSPFKNPKQCLARKRSVLALMLKNQRISQAEYEHALGEELPEQNQRSYSNNSFLHFVFDELGTIAEEKSLSLGGQIEIFTGFCPNLQSKMEEIAKTVNDCDKMMLALNAQTGNFKACVSSCGNIPRLPGSIIKPLLVYAPALEENILVPATPILDEKVDYGGYRPQNFDEKYHGYVSARECVAKSFNIPAVKVFQSLGIQKGIAYLQKMGLTIEAGDESLALALGGMKKGFTLRELTTAYSALETGVLKNCGFISEIKIDGIPVFKRPNEEKRIISQESAYLMTDMLKSTVKDGTAKKLRSLPFDVAAKTGTVGTAKGNTDAYAISYTTQDVLSVWLGNADNQPIPYTGGSLPCNLLTELNEQLYNHYLQENRTISPFKKPSGIQSVELDKTTYYDTHNIMLADENSPSEYRFKELFKSTAIPSKKSDFFSNPSIPAPKIKVLDNSVIIEFSNASPTVYEYKIERYDYVTHTILYTGEFIREFIDSNLKEDAEYLYTVTPYYNQKAGKPISLPAVSLKELKEQKILNQDWWDS